MADIPGRKLNVGEFAHWAGLSVSTANKMRLNGKGPRYLKFRRRVLYDLKDAEAWACAATSSLVGSSCCSSRKRA
jgi:hypothetical protein